ncbi:MAG: YdeI/OmpD-associated family protein [Gemmatimonadota bacterium]
MGTRDPRIDRYIDNSADFARPILSHIREAVHATCPDVEETMKWSFPHFMYKGMLCSMASFKQHCAFGFWKGALVLDGPGDGEAMGHFGRITRVQDLPSRTVLRGYLKKAMKLNDDGVSVVKPARAKKSPASLRVPPDLAAALDANRVALDNFDAFSASHRREYIEWVTEAKREATRARRIEQAIAMLQAGKSRNWKYEKS